MRRASAAGGALGLCALLFACGRPAEPPVAPAPVAIATPAPAPTVEPSHEHAVTRGWICVDAPATPLTPEMREEQRSWVRRTIRMSKHGEGVAIVVDKAGYALHLYERGERTRSYPIQLGLDPVNDKVMEDDCRTPEGIYRIVAKRTTPKTAYTIAFLLDYPNFRDYAEFVSMRHRTRQLPLDVRIGGNILIHGGGENAPGNAQDGWNWTKGCIALSDENIRDLALHTRAGMPVAIVRELDRKAYR